MFFYDDHLDLLERTAIDVCHDEAIAPSPSISRQDHRPYPSYMQYSPPLLDHDGLEDLVLAPHIASANNIACNMITQSQTPPLPSESEPSTNDKNVSSAAAAAATAPSKTVTHKRSNRKDRHSKIVTAQGTRERRVRLSVDVAKKFFDLQDVLGFDKASKTVEWLLTESARAIKAVTSYSNKSTQHHGGCGSSWKVESSASGCNVIKCSSASGKKNAVDGLQAVPAPESTGSILASDPSVLLRKPRLKARGRAREKTGEKQSTNISASASLDQGDGNM